MAVPGGGAKRKSASGSAGLNCQLRNWNSMEVPPGSVTTIPASSPDCGEISMSAGGALPEPTALWPWVVVELGSRRMQVKTSSPAFTGRSLGAFAILEHTLENFNSPASSAKGVRQSSLFLAGTRATVLSLGT